jgi:hypothetical protein
LSKIAGQWDAIKKEADIKTVCFHAEDDLVVAEDSSNAPCNSGHLVKIQLRNHTSIVRVANKDDEFIKKLADWLQNIFASSYAEVLLNSSDVRACINMIFQEATKHKSELLTTQYTPSDTDPNKKPDFLDTLIKATLREHENISVSFSRYALIENSRYVSSYVNRFFQAKPPNLDLSLYLVRPGSMPAMIEHASLFVKANFILMKGEMAYCALGKVAASEKDDNRLGVYLKDRVSLWRLEALWTKLVQENNLVYCLKSEKDFLGVSVHDFVAGLISDLLRDTELKQQIKLIGLFGGYAADARRFSAPGPNLLVDFVSQFRDDIDLFFVVASGTDIEQFEGKVTSLSNAFDTAIDIHWGDEKSLYEPRKKGKITFDIEVFWEGDNSYVDGATTTREFEGTQSRKLLGYSIFSHFLTLYSPNQRKIEELIEFPKQELAERGRIELCLEADKGLRYFSERLVKIRDRETDGKRVVAQLAKNYFWALTGVRPKSSGTAILKIQEENDALHEAVKKALEIPKREQVGNLIEIMSLDLKQRIIGK